MLIGLIGRPSSGKSTFFKAATLADVLIADYPFATIKPNHAMAYIKIKDLANEFGKESNPREGYVKKGQRFVPFELVDVAGLVEGASQGKGLGNEFLNDLAAADALIHIVDISGETNGEGKPSKNYYPGEDIKIIENELDLWYLGILLKVWKKFSRTVEVEKKNFSEAVAQQFSGLKVNENDVRSAILKENLNAEKPTSWTQEEIRKFSRTLRKISKPMIISANKIDRPKGKENYQRIKKEFDYEIIPCFADGELALREADKAKLIEYMPGEENFEIKKEMNEKQKNALEKIRKVIKEFNGTNVQKILNKTILEILNYISIFPAGSKLKDSQGRILPDCYLMPKGSTALDFAFKLHTDIGKGFIKAIDIRTKRAVGKGYILKHLDGLEIITN